MDTHANRTSLEVEDRKEDLRDLDARQKQIIASLPASILYNPLMTVFAAVVFVLGPDTFGYVSWLAIAAAIAIQLVTSALGRVVYIVNRDKVRDLHVKERELIAYQMLYSAGCGAMAWCFWVDGNAVNNMYVILLMVCVVWQGAFRCAAHRPILVVGTLSAGLVFTARFAFAPGTEAHVMTLLAPAWLLYIVLVGGIARNRVDEMLAARFANEDLTDALRLARDDALRKRFEAEAANASKTIFLANMSHELRTPVECDPGFLRHHRRAILRSGARPLLRICARHPQFRRASAEPDQRPARRRQDRGRQDGDRSPAARSGAAARKRAAPDGLARAAKGQKLDFELSRNMRQIIADPRAIKQIVLNLVTNAVKFTRRADISRSNASSPTAAASPSASRTTARASRRKSSPRCSSRSARSTTATTAMAAAPGSALRSCRPGAAPRRQRDDRERSRASEPKSRFIFR